MAVKSVRRAERVSVTWTAPCILQNFSTVHSRSRTGFTSRFAWTWSPFVVLRLLVVAFVVHLPPGSSRPRRSWTVDDPAVGEQRAPIFENDDAVAEEAPSLNGVRRDHARGKPIRLVRPFTARIVRAHGRVLGFLCEAPRLCTGRRSAVNGPHRGFTTNDDSAPLTAGRWVMESPPGSATLPQAVPDAQVAPSAEIRGQGEPEDRE